MNNFLIKKPIWLHKITKPCIRADDTKFKIMDIIMIESVHCKNFFYNLRDCQLKMLFAKIFHIFNRESLKSVIFQMCILIIIAEQFYFIKKFKVVKSDYSKILLFMYITIYFLQCYEKFLNGWSHCPFALPIESTYKKVSIYGVFFRL